MPAISCYRSGTRQAPPPAPPPATMVSFAFYAPAVGMYDSGFYLVTIV
jgi:hypothetical protein